MPACQALEHLPVLPAAAMVPPIGPPRAASALQGRCLPQSGACFGGARLGGRGCSSVAALAIAASHRPPVSSSSCSNVLALASDCSDSSAGHWVCHSRPGASGCWADSIG
ncbi:unnamed protein product [Prorocentrum cordatum]|uniref:Uncharacterized protein n=1 Tax=Prorocentrum cordatum TaxID=2364126 RepID=A0ABN9R5N5_9DINO|nr:unnamed protein product [Polarella glacialis]